MFGYIFQVKFKLNFHADPASICQLIPSLPMPFCYQQEILQICILSASHAREQLRPISEYNAIRYT